jgi:hypothetical protein
MADFQYDPVEGWENETEFPDYPLASEVRPLFQRLFNQIRDVFNLTKNDYETHKAETATISELGHVNHATLAVTIPSTVWTGASAPYSKTIAVAGMLATDNPIVDVDLSSAANYAAEQAILTAWGLVYRIATGTDEITVYATAVPITDIPIALKVVR